MKLDVLGTFDYGCASLQLMGVLKKLIKVLMGKKNTSSTSLRNIQTKKRIIDQHYDNNQRV